MSERAENQEDLEAVERASVVVKKMSVLELAEHLKTFFGSDQAALREDNRLSEKKPE